MNRPSPSINDLHDDSYMRFLLSQQFKLNEQRKSLLDLLDSLTSTRTTSSDDLIIHIGSGIWTSKSPSQAKELTKRQIGHVSSALKIISEDLANQFVLRKRQDDSTPVSPEDAGHSTSQSLPFVEIEEQLDNNGNVIVAKLNDQLFFSKSDAHLTTNAFEEGPVEWTPNTVGSVENLPKNDMPQFSEGGKLKHDDQLDELLHDMEINNPENDVGGKPLESSTTGSKDLGSSLDSKSLSDMRSLYELELIAGQFHSEDEEPDQLEEFDYEFESSDDESSDNQSSSNFMEMMDTSVLPGNSYASNRLREEIIALRQKRLDGSGKPSSIEPRRVRFNETLEIKEIENVSEDLMKIEHKKHKISRFRESKILSDKPVKQKQVTSAPNEDSSINESSPPSHTKSNPGKSTSNEVMCDIVERTQEGFSSDPIGESNSINSKENGVTTKKNEQGSVDADISPPQADQYREEMNTLSAAIVESQRLETDREEASRLSETLSALVSPHEEVNSKDEMDKLVRSYLKGEFDEDISVSGPVVNKLDDFTRLNKLIESMNVNDTERKAVLKDPQNFMNVQSTDEVGNFSSDSSDEEIMVESIIEREDQDLQDMNEADDIHGADHVEQYVIDREISEQYYRLKEKIASERDSHLDNEDNPGQRKFSRFMSRQFQSSNRK